MQSVIGAADHHAVLHAARGRAWAAAALVLLGGLVQACWCDGLAAAALAGRARRRWRGLPLARGVRRRAAGRRGRAARRPARSPRARAGAARPAAVPARRARAAVPAACTTRRSGRARRWPRWRSCAAAWSAGRAGRAAVTALDELAARRRRAAARHRRRAPSCPGSAARAAALHGRRSASATRERWARLGRAAAGARATRRPPPARPTPTSAPSLVGEVERLATDLLGQLEAVVRLSRAASGPAPDPRRSTAGCRTRCRRCGPT